jgi:hypothetical protein
MRKLVYAFYNQPFSFRQLITQFPPLKGDVTDCLMDNLSRDFQPLFEAVAKLASVPEPLPHGKPPATREVPESCGWSKNSCGAAVVFE